MDNGVSVISKSIPRIRIHNTRNPITYPIEIENTLKFHELYNQKYLGTMEIRNLSEFTMIYKFFHSNPALEEDEFEVRNCHGSLAFEERRSILVTPRYHLTPPYLKNVVFEFWAMPESLLPYSNCSSKLEEDWNIHARNSHIMKVFITSIVHDSRQYLERLLINNFEDSRKSVSNVPSGMSLLGGNTQNSPSNEGNTRHHLSSHEAVRVFVSEVLEEQENRQKSDVRLYASNELQVATIPTQALKTYQQTLRRSLSRRFQIRDCHKAKWYHPVYFFLHVGGTLLIFTIIAKYADVINKYLPEGSTNICGTMDAAV